MKVLLGDDLTLLFEYPKEVKMRHKKIILSLSLLTFFGISCGLFSSTSFSPAPTEGNQPTLYSVNDALTLAAQTINAATSDTLTPVPATNTLVGSTPTLIVVTDNQFAILGEHHVVSGETISCIGRGYGVLPKAIADANRIDLIAELQAGQVLRIPAIPWTDISAGPICAPQFTPPSWVAEAPDPPQPTQKPQEDSNSIQPTAANPTQPPVANPTQPPVSNPTQAPVVNPTQPTVVEPTKPPEIIPTQPPETNPTKQPVVVIIPPRCPPICIILPTLVIYTPPTDPPLGGTEPPPGTSSP